MRAVHTIAHATSRAPLRRLATAWLGGAVLAISAAAVAAAAPSASSASQPAAAASTGTTEAPRTAADSSIAAPVTQQLERLANDAASTAWDAQAGPVRVEVVVGKLDPRLQLAACDRIEPYLPPGQRPFGRTHVGLRCLQGPTHWNVFLPVTVQVFARALVATTVLPVGTLLQSRHLTEAEVDVAERVDPALRDATQALGRTLARAVPAGAALHQGDLRLRQWFNAGDLVRVVVHGSGWSVSADGQALGAGVEGQPVRVRTDAGRVVSGLPTPDRRVEVTL